MTAKATLSDGGTVQDCATFYIEGPAGGIRDPHTPSNREDVITPELDSFYTGSYSYGQYLVNDPNGGTATQNLMTGVAYHEPQYRQFTSPADNPAHSDLWNLYKGTNKQVAGKWPNENLLNGNVTRGANIGLMQPMTASNQTTDPHAWNWIQNATDGIGTFSNKRLSGGDDKVQDAMRYEGYIITGHQSGKVSILSHTNPDGSYIRGLQAVERENNSLVLYAGDVNGSNVSCTVTELYFIPQCSGKVTTKNNVATCSTT